MHHLMDIIAYMGHIHRVNSNPSDKYYSLCMKNAGRIQKIVKLIISVYAMATVVDVTPAIYDYYITGQMQPIAYAYFIGIREYNNVLMALLNVFNLIMLASGVMAYIATDVIIFTVFANIHLLSLIIDREIQDLDDQFDRPDLTRSEVKFRLVKIVSMYRKYSQ